MKKRPLLIFIMLIGLSYGLAQEEGIAWSKEYQLTIKDFKNPETEIAKSVSSVFIQSGATIELGFQMSNFSFMFTKHFNNKVSCTFYRKAALLMAPDSLSADRLVELSQFDFDLSELYARKIRKELYENKKTFSKSNFFEPYFNKMIQERNEKSGQVYKASEFGTAKEVLKKEHEWVLGEIEKLSDYCKSCKPPKKSKKR